MTYTKDTESSTYYNIERRKCTYLIALLEDVRRYCEAKA